MDFALDTAVRELQNGSVLTAKEKAQFVLAGFVKAGHGMSKKTGDALHYLHSVLISVSTSNNRLQRR